MNRILNALSVDVEDYFQVSAFSDVVPYRDWGRFESRVERNTLRLLELFDQRKAKATFFILGWVAERCPGLVREIALRGHEVGSHGYAHRTIDQCTPEEFREEVRGAKRLLEDLSQAPVIGYRAPSFSITERTLWALEILAEEGFSYDSSIFPIHHDRYGIPGAPRFRYPLRFGERVLHELPLSTISLGRRINLPVAGGGYLRFLPLWLTRWGIRRINERERQPAVVYVHPWEIDPHQPSIAGKALARFRHYRNLHDTVPRLDALLRTFRWGTFRSVLFPIAPPDGAAGPSRSPDAIAANQSIAGVTGLAQTSDR